MGSQGSKIFQTENYYYKFGNFRSNFIFVNSIKTHICDVRYPRLVHDIRISVNDRLIVPFLVSRFARV